MALYIDPRQGTTSHQHLHRSSTEIGTFMHNVFVAADMLTVGFQSLYKYNTHDKQAQ